MIRNACYMAIVLHFLRKIFRRALPPALQDGVHRYLVLMGPYKDDKIGSMAAVVASTNDIVLAQKIAKEINGGKGVSLYIISYPDMRVLDLITSFPRDKEEDIKALKASNRELKRQISRLMKQLQPVKPMDPATVNTLVAKYFK